MLPVRIEDDYVIDRAFSRPRYGEPMPQSGFNRLAFALVLFMNDHLSASFPSVVCGFVCRAVIDNQNVVESLSRPPHDVANMFFLVISGNNCCDARLIQGGFRFLVSC